MKLYLKNPQWTVFRCDQRFRVLVAGRRFGKTYLALTELCQAAWGPGRTAWYVAPTYKQAKGVAWKRLKQLTQPYWATPPRETDLTIELAAGGTISLRGADNYDSLRGHGIDFVALDEYASMAREVWPEVLRPMLSDRQGRALFIGTPKGYNHLQELFEKAQQQPDWAAFQYTTEQGGRVPAAELAAAAREMDERTYRQEFQATFENLGTGRAYYTFERNSNVAPLQYEPRQPLFWSLDFNVHPMCAVLGQIINGETVHVLEEIVLEDSNTPDACRAFLERTEKWSREAPQPLSLYGDACGASRHSSASRTDWQIVQDCLRGHGWRFEVSDRVPRENPRIKDRINCVNALLRNELGQHRLRIDPRCRELIRDLEQVAWKTDAHGNHVPELDKSDRRRTHTSDALGYMVAEQFPRGAGFAGFSSERLF